jgi:predicted site-specific integrase-resolvase
MTKKFLSAQELVDRWGGAVSSRTLANWRTQGKGPRYVRVGGRIIYAIEEVEAWEKRRSVQSTSEYAKDTFSGEGI